MNKNEILDFIKEKIEKSEFNFYMYCADYDYTERNLKEKIKQLGFEIYLPDSHGNCRLRLTSFPPKYRVGLKIIKNENNVVKCRICTNLMLKLEGYSEYICKACIKKWEEELNSNLPEW